jgi:plasmid stabilization system protein ParE
MIRKIQEVRWSPTGKATRIYITQQIINRWSIDIAIKFDDEVEALIKRIKENNNICPKSLIQNVHKCTLSYQTSLIYQLYGDYIEILALIDNRSEHSF